MWNIFIPAAPALVTVAPGLWRNICPMSTFSLLPKQFGLSLRTKMPEGLAAWLGLASVIALYAIVPLRHVLLNTDGPATFIMLGTAAALALVLGAVFEGRSGWCTSLCPIHPVEKLYGSSPAVTPANARCDTCVLCTVPCPDTTPSMNPAVTRSNRLMELTGSVLIGSFWGFVFGWYQVQDYVGPVGTAEIVETYLWPLGAAFVSFAIYNALETWFAQTRPAQRHLQAVFAAGAVSTYYWFRIPMLVGFGAFPETGLLFDLTAVLPLVPDGFAHADHLVLLLVPGDPRTHRNGLGETPALREQGTGRGGGGGLKYAKRAVERSPKSPLTLSLSPSGERTPECPADNSSVPSPLGEKDKMRGDFRGG